MADEVHGYLREARNTILSQIEALHTGQIEVWDIGAQPCRNISGERIAVYKGQLAATEELMRKFEVSFDA